MSVAVRSSSSVYQAALAALQAQISVIPIVATGEKSPAIRWKRYQQQRPTLMEVRHWFLNTSYGLAFVTGQVSGGLEALDFDTRGIYEDWAERARAEGLSPLLERIECGYKEESPKGVHLLYRCSSIERSQKLAEKPLAGSNRVASLIETRGQGGCCIVAPSCGQVHPSGRPYQLLRGSPHTIQKITPQERESLFSIAHTFHEGVPPAPLPQPTIRKGLRGRRPGDIYNERVTWEELLPFYGWEAVRSVGEEIQWRRPGKEGRGISATTNYQSTDLFYVFSTSTCFEPQRGYTKFGVYTLLEHGGNYSVAARALVEQGYVDEY